MNRISKNILGSLLVLLGVAVVLWRTKDASLPSAEPSAQPTNITVPAAFSPSTAAQSQALLSSGVSKQQRRFTDMGVLERNAIRREIAKQDPSAVFQAMLDAGRVEHDPLKQMGLQTTFAGVLREKRLNPKVLNQMRDFLLNSSNSDFERQLLIGALESASTEEAVDLLSQVAATSSEQKIKEAAGGLAGVGNLGHGGPELSPILEQVWRESNDPKQLLGVASSIAKIGTPSGVELLLSSALSTDNQDKVRVDAAQYALKEVYMPSAVPPLVARLANQAPTSVTAQLVAPILVKIGDTAASRAILGWL